MHRFIGPTEESNWLIPGKLIVGGCPLTPEEVENIAQEGVTTFVCLLDRDDFSSYISKKEYKALARPFNIKVVCKPIPDGDITTDSRAFSIARMIFRNLKRKGIVVYLHCWGGHGRAGTIGAMVLGLWFRKPFVDIISFLQNSHQTRAEGGDHPTPQTEEQIYQVARFFEEENIPIYSA